MQKKKNSFYQDEEFEFDYDSVLQEEDEDDPEFYEEEEEEEESEEEEEENNEEEEEGEVTFLSELNRLAGFIPKPTTETEEEDEEEDEIIVKPKKKKVAQPELMELSDLEDLNDDDFKKIISNPKDFIGFLKNYGSQVAQQTETKILKELPKKLKATVKTEMDFDRAATTFWNANDDLKPAAEFVAQMASRIKALNPKKSNLEVFNEAGKEVRKSLKSLGLNTKIEEEQGLPRTGRSARRIGAKKVEDPENDVASTIAAANGIYRKK